MCGIFGWHTKYKNKTIRKKAVVFGSVLSYANDKRGGDSWGVYAFGQIMKGLGDICQADRHAISMMYNSPTVLGHTRKATTGDVVVENSHPFRIQNLVGAHNGIVSNHEDLNKTNGRACTVDSQHIFHHIVEDKPLSDINTYGAIEYVRTDCLEDGVFLGKFHGGSLTIAKTEIGPVWNSDKWDLISALRIAGIKFRLYKIEEGWLYQLLENKAYKIKSLDFTKYEPVFKSEYVSYGSYGNWEGWSRAKPNWDIVKKEWVSDENFQK